MTQSWKKVTPKFRWIYSEEDNILWVYTKQKIRGTAIWAKFKFRGKKKETISREIYFPTWNIAALTFPTCSYFHYSSVSISKVHICLRYVNMFPRDVTFFSISNATVLNWNLFVLFHSNSKLVNLMIFSSEHSAIVN